MTLNTKELDNQQENEITKFLPEKKREELEEILAFGEKYKIEGEKMLAEFWTERNVQKFVNLILYYQKNEDKNRKIFEKGLTSNEKKILASFSKIAKDKFYAEYLYNIILYNGNSTNDYYSGGEIDYSGDGTLESLKEWANCCKDNLEPGMHIHLEGQKFGDDGIKILVEEWRGNLQPGMYIDLGNNEIGKKGAEVLARGWRNSLQSGMEIRLWYNDIGEKGAEILAREWKNRLQPGMLINLMNNNIGEKGAEVLAGEWKDSLQPGMVITLGSNHIGNKGVKVLAEEWKGKLKEGMRIDLFDNNIGDEGVDVIMKNLELKEGMIIDLEDNNITKEKENELSDWVKSYHDKGINCKVMVGSLVL